MVRTKNLDKVAADNLRVVAKNKAEIKIEKEKNPGVPIKEKIYEIMGHTKSPLSSLLVNPHVFSFEEISEDENIYLVARPHWITNLSWILMTIIMALVPILMNFIPIAELGAKYRAVISFAWYLVTFAFAFEKFLSWYFDVVIITNKRIIDIDFANLLMKKFSEARLSVIQDITSRVNGVAQTLFNYGNISVQTAGEMPEITLEKIADPEKIVKILQILREEEVSLNLVGGALNG